MSTIKDGGPAFPVNFDHQTFCPKNVDEAKRLMSGMSLRDHFAGLAMQAQLITDGQPGEAADALLEDAAACGQDPVYRLALNSYDVADAMLRARDAK